MLKMQKYKTTANPLETNQHEENCYKVDGYKSIHYRKHCSTIIQSVRKIVLPTNVDNCFKLLNKCPDCTLQALTLFVAQISTGLLLYLILFSSEWNETTGLLQIGHENTQCLMLPHVTPTMNATTSCYRFFQGIFIKKTLVKDPSKILATNCSLVFLGGSHRLTKLDCYDLLLHDVTEDYNNIGSRGFIVGPKA